MNDNLPQMRRPLVAHCMAAATDGMERVVSRFERNRGYPYIDTKLSTITGRDFPEPDDSSVDFRGKSAVFGWIQGRGLEALAGHAAFLTRSPGLAIGCDRMLDTVASQMTELGSASHGRYAFLFTPDGRPFRCGAEGRREFYSVETLPPGFTDLFTGKGLTSAGARLGRTAWRDAGTAVFRNAVRAIVGGTFVSDQVSFDPKNPVHPVHGRRTQGSWMIAFGGYALMCGLYPGEEEWVRGAASSCATFPIAMSFRKPQARHAGCRSGVSHGLVPDRCSGGGSGGLWGRPGGSDRGEGARPMQHGFWHGGGCVNRPAMARSLASVFGRKSE